MVQFADAPDAQQDTPDRLIGQVTSKFAPFTHGIQDELYGLLSSDDVFAAYLRGGLLEQVAGILETNQPELEQALYDAQVAAWFTRASQVVDEASVARVAAEAGELIAAQPPSGPPLLSIVYPPGDEPLLDFPIINKAIRKLEESRILAPQDYYALEHATRNNAFTISADISQGTLERVRSLLSENVATVSSREQFTELVRETIPRLPISDAHLEQVFRNNVNEAYSAGGEAVITGPLVESAFPYRAYHAIHDSRARPTHLRLETMGIDGTNIYHRHDPVWQIFRPPWEWNCRCGWSPISIRQAARLGVGEASLWLETGEEPPHAFATVPDFLPPDSWRRIAA